MSKPLKIFFAWTQNCGTAYYRFIQFAKYMRLHRGVEVAYSKYTQYDQKVIAWQNELDNEVVLKQLEMLFSTADISVMGYITNLKALALIKAIKHKYPKKKILMEMDDYVFNLTGTNMASGAFKTGSDNEWIIEKQMELSDGMIVSTNYLKNAYAQYNKNIKIVPNGVDLEKWTKPKPRESKDIIIGFAGTPNHKSDIRLIKTVIEQILTKYPNVKFKFIGCDPELPKNDRIIVNETFVGVEDWPEYIQKQDFDIALAPLRDNLFNRAKSNLRFLEMSMLQIPTVASRIIPYQETIKNAKTGFLCTNVDEWIMNLSTLIENKELREKIGKTAYNFVIQNYNAKNSAEKYIQILENMIKK
jgi:glycosyltransferase involved in cell wall biosynthesis